MPIGTAGPVLAEDERLLEEVFSLQEELAKQLIPHFSDKIFPWQQLPTQTRSPLLELMSEAPPDRITLIFRGAAVIWLGVNHRLLGDLDKASRLFEESAALNQQAGNIYAALASFEQSAELAGMRGQLHQAVEIQRRGLQVAKRWADEGGKGRGASVAASGLHLQLGTILYQWNDLAGAAPHIQRAIELHDLGEVWGRVHSYMMLAYLKQAEGDFEASYDLLCKVHAIQDTISVSQANITALPSLEKLGIILSRAHPDMAYLLTDAARRIETQGIQPEDQLGRDHTTRKIVRFVALESDAVYCAAGATAHAYILR